MNAASASFWEMEMEGAEASSVFSLIEELNPKTLRRF